jgi:hypothetical protein
MLAHTGLGLLAYEPEQIQQDCLLDCAKLETETYCVKLRAMGVRRIRQNRCEEPSTRTRKPSIVYWTKVQYTGRPAL